MFLLYLWMKCSRHRAVFVHFRPYETTMIMSVASVILLNIPAPSPETRLFRTVEALLFIFGVFISPALYFSYTFTHVFFLYRNSVRGYLAVVGYPLPRWLCYLSMIGIAVSLEIIVFVLEAFQDFTVFRQFIIALFFWVPQTVLVFLNLLIWFIWWLKLNNQQPLPPVKISYVISAIVYVAVTTLYGVSWIILSFCIPEIKVTFANGCYVYYIPHFWILAAVISSHPEVQRVFQKKKDQNVEVFQLAYISV